METTVSSSRAVSYDLGLRSFLTGVYNRMGVGLLITAAFAYLTGNTVLGDAFFKVLPNGKIDYTILGMAVAFGPLVLIVLMGFVMKNAHSRAGSAFLFYASSVMFGLSSGMLFKVYTGMSLATTFVITSAMFGGLSLWGYTTKRDLGPIGGFLVAALIGLIIAMIASIFIPGLSMLVTVAGILIFSAFIAYDTQRLKTTYSELHGAGEDEVAAAQNMSAFNLYLDFINLFQFLLRLVGVRIGGDD